MRGNPLQEFIPDELFFKLQTKGFLNERAVRDFYMKKRFEALKKTIPPKKIFSMLQAEFPYLSVDTVRKIIYTRNGFHTTFD
ncbi:MAG TPA: hypothetical protein ENK14_05245 [Caldithrix sp.]|nr:hypothetical protein [Caldithrix sp.]